jgi:hypothetical protein
MEILARYGAHTGGGLELCADYSYADLVPTTSWRSLWAWAGLAIAAGLIFAATRARKTRAGDALLLFAASYVAVSNIFSPATASLADRLFFLPSFFLVVAIAIALSEQRLFMPIALAFVVVQTVLAAVSMRMWRDERSLALHNMAVCPHNGRIREMRAHVAYLDRDVQTTAWQMIARAAIYNEFPNRIRDDVLSSDWEAMPLAERLSRLRAAFPDRYHAAVLRGALLCRSGGYREAENLVMRILLTAHVP